jgi:hypothetical protein
MDKVIQSIQSGDLVDLGSLTPKPRKEGQSQYDFYMQSMASKYPALAPRLMAIKAKDKKSLMMKLSQAETHVQKPVAQKI